MNHLTFFKKVDRHGVSYLTIRHATKLPQMPEQFLLPGRTQMPNLGFGQLSLLDLRIPKLHRIVTMMISGLHGRDTTGTRLNHRHGMETTVFVVNLRHTQLFSY